MLYIDKRFPTRDLALAYTLAPSPRPAGAIDRFLNHPDRAIQVNPEWDKAPWSVVFEEGKPVLVDRRNVLATNP